MGKLGVLDSVALKALSTSVVRLPQLESVLDEVLGNDFGWLDLLESKVLIAQNLHISPPYPLLMT